MLHARLAWHQGDFWFEYVRSAANPADAPSRAAPLPPGFTTAQRCSITWPPVSHIVHPIDAVNAAAALASTAGSS